jgi:hypothetical protein
MSETSYYNDDFGDITIGEDFSIDSDDISRSDSGSDDSDYGVYESGFSYSKDKDGTIDISIDISLDISLDWDYPIPKRYEYHDYSVEFHYNYTHKKNEIPLVSMKSNIYEDGIDYKQVENFIKNVEKSDVPDRLKQYIINVIEHQ